MKALSRLLLTKTGIAVAVLALVAIVAAMHFISRPAQANTSAAAMAMPVDVETVKPAKVRLWSTFPARMVAVDYAQIRPEVSGRVTEIRFREGQTVKAGDVLMVLDPQPYEAAVSKAEADLASANAKLEYAKLTLARSETLVKTNTISKAMYDQRVSDSEVAAADVKAATAELALAKVDLDRAYVKAPITGRISRAEVTTGNLVQAGAGAPVLTSIVSSDGIYAEFDVDEQTYLTSVRRSGPKALSAIPVEIDIQGDQAHPYAGTIYSFDNHIDPTTGTIRARARFADADGALVPGMFVSIKMAQPIDQAVVIVPQRAIGEDQSRKFVFVVDKDNKVVYREVSLGADAGGGNRVVTGGLTAGERVIVNGVQHVRPDMPVAPTDITKDLVLASAN